MFSQRKTAGIGVSLLIATICGVLLLRQANAPALQIPERLGDAEYWNMIVEMSEPGGFFRSDNFVSNETTFQHVIPELQQRARTGVYIGVGPDQNFSYIVALEPSLAFIVDIRRQNMLQHLLFKALIEMSPDRAAFLSMLFCRPLAGMDSAETPIDRLMAAIGDSTSDSAALVKNVQSVRRWLTEHHSFDLPDEDVDTIRYVYASFVTAGPDIRYSFPSGRRASRFPTFSELVQQDDGQGTRRSYLATEANYQFLRQMHMQNRIIPLVGDFAGDKALREVGRYLKRHNAKVSAFYTSNVEFYLFQTDDWKSFFANVESLPLARSSTFIRAYFDNNRFSRPADAVRPVTTLDDMNGFLGDFRNGSIRTYSDVIERAFP